MKQSVGSPRGTRPRRIFQFAVWLILALVALTVAVAVIPPLRRGALRKAGWLLVAQRATPKSADIIVIATDAEYPGALQAADLVRNSVATRVAIFPMSEPWESEYLRRGVRYQEVESLTAQYLHQMGVSDVEHIGQPVTGSENEGVVLPAWCDQNHFNSILVITTPDHSRRLNRILRRSMKGHHTTYTVVSTPYARFDADRWWQSRGGVRTEIEESEKLLLDVLRHPLS